MTPMKTELETGGLSSSPSKVTVTLSKENGRISPLSFFCLGFSFKMSKTRSVKKLNLAALKDREK